MTDSIRFRRLAQPGLAAALLPFVLALPGSATELEKPTFSGGAVDAAGGSSKLLATVGESGIVGETSGGSFRLSLGFWGGHFRTIATDAPGAPVIPQIQYVNGLRQNTPNPFAGNTDIAFSVATRAPTHLEVYDVTGRRVRTLLHSVSAPGRHLVRWDGRDDARRSVSTGVYFYRLSVGDWSETRKMLRLR